MSSMRAFERWIEKQFAVLAHVAGRPIEDLLDGPEEAVCSALAPEVTFALGVIAGAAGTLQVTPRELLEQLELLPAARRSAASSPP